MTTELAIDHLITLIKSIHITKYQGENFSIVASLIRGDAKWIKNFNTGDPTSGTLTKFQIALRSQPASYQGNLSVHCSDRIQWEVCQVGHWAQFLCVFMLHDGVQISWHWCSSSPGGQYL